MKIGIYNPYLDDLGGGEKYMMSIAECLSKNHGVTVFWDRKADIDELLQRFSLDLSRVKLAKNIFSRRVNIFERLLSTIGFDAIIVLSDGSIPFSLSKKLFVHFQAPILNANINTLRNKIKIARVNKFFCNAYYTKFYVDKEFGIDSVVLYPPVNMHTKEVKKENIILHVGRFRVKKVKIGDYKKQDVMIDAFKKMVKKGLEKWRFVLAVGVTDEDRVLFSSSQEIAKGFPIEFLVNRNNQELWDIYSRAKIYWHASGYGEDLEKHPEYAEHFGISTVEAMGAGAVPVVIKAGGQKEIVKDGKNGFLWDTLEELQEKTLRLVHDQILWDRLSKEAKKRAQFFSGRRFCEELEKIIK